MAAPILRRADLLHLSPSGRLAVFHRAAREIEAELDRIQAHRLRYWNGHSRAFHLQSLYARRQQLVVLAREAGCGDWEAEPTRAA
jgi:hypothetical protein